MRFALVVCTLPLLLSGCVMQHRYDTAIRERDGEHARREQAEADLARLNESLAAANAALRAREQALAADQSALAQTKLMVDRTATERDDATGLVEQLRGDLARVGANLKEYSAQKDELEKALSDAEARAHRLDELKRSVQERVLLMRDLSRAAAESGSRNVTIAVVDGYPALRIQPDALFSGKELAKTEAGVLRRLAEILAPKKDLRVQLEDLSGPGITPEDRIARLQKVTNVLSDGGVGFDRLGFSVPGEGEAPPSMYRDGTGTIEIAIKPTVVEARDQSTALANPEPPPPAAVPSPAP